MGIKSPAIVPPGCVTAASKTRGNLGMRGGWVNKWEQAAGEKTRDHRGQVERQGGSMWQRAASSQCHLVLFPFLSPSFAAF